MLPSEERTLIGFGHWLDSGAGAEGGEEKHDEILHLGHLRIE